MEQCIQQCNTKNLQHYTSLGSSISINKYFTMDLTPNHKEPCLVARINIYSPNSVFIKCGLSTASKKSYGKEIKQPEHDS
uniref:Uncharacterized protein n=1 Tax=Arundo donax TaxID=35708 RepID=A0A0A8YVC0_ARUDO